MDALSHYDTRTESTSFIGELFEPAYVEPAYEKWWEFSGTLECIALSEAFDLLKLLCSNGRIKSKRNEVSITADGFTYTIKALNTQLHDWSDDHCTDEIEVHSYKSCVLVATKKYLLAEIKNIHGIIKDCRIEA